MAPVEERLLVAGNVYQEQDAPGILLGRNMARR